MVINKLFNSTTLGQIIKSNKKETEEQINNDNKINNNIKDALYKLNKKSLKKLTISSVVISTSVSTPLPLPHFNPSSFNKFPSYNSLNSFIKSLYMLEYSLCYKLFSKLI